MKTKTRSYAGVVLASTTLCLGTIAAGCNYNANSIRVEDQANQISLISTSVITYDSNTMSVTKVKLDSQRLAMLRTTEKQFRATEQEVLASEMERFASNNDKTSELKNLINIRNETSVIAGKLAESCNGDIPATIYKGLSDIDWALGFKEAQKNDDESFVSAERSSCEKIYMEKIW